MKKIPAKKRKSRMPILIAGLLFTAWCVAVVLAVGESFSGSDEKSEINDQAVQVVPRGSNSRYPVLDRNFRELAVSFPMKSVYARPLEVEDPESSALFLAQELGLDEKRLQRDFHEERGFFWLGRQVPEAKVRKIREANLHGIYIVDESQRYYPQGLRASHVVGIVGEGHGLSGIEAKYDRQLRGLAEPLDSEGDSGRQGPLVLTLDLRVQELLETQLNRIVQATSATGGCGLVMVAGSGEVLALANQPSYDPNFFWEYDEEDRQNRLAVTDFPADGFLGLFRLAALYQNGPASEKGQDAEGIKLAALKTDLKLSRLLERKDVSRKRLVKGDGIYLSPALEALGQLDEPADFNSFLDELGLNGKLFVELPDETKTLSSGSLRVSAVGLLAGLNNLLTLNKPGTPHLLAGVLDRGSGRLYPGNVSSEQLLRPEVVAKMRHYFQELGRENGGITLLEALKPSPSPDTPEEHEKSESSGDRKHEKFRTLLVASDVGEKSPRIILLLALEQARLDPERNTPMRSAAEQIIPRARDWAGKKTETASWQDRENQWRAEWLELQSGRAGKVNGEARVNRRQMPDLKGLSLRKALQVLNRYGMKVRVQGTGRVIGQQPGAGKVINKDECSLVLAGLR